MRERDGEFSIAVSAGRIQAIGCRSAPEPLRAGASPLRFAAQRHRGRDRKGRGAHRQGKLRVNPRAALAERLPMSRGADGRRTGAFRAILSSRWSLRATPLPDWPLGPSMRRSRCRAPARGNALFPYGDPAVASAFCRFDLTNGPFRVKAPIGRAGFCLAVVPYAARRIFYALTDKAATHGVMEALVPPRTIARAGRQRRRGCPRRICASSRRPRQASS